MNKVDYNGMSFHYPTAKFSYVKMTIYYAIKARYTHYQCSRAVSTGVIF